MISLAAIAILTGCTTATAPTAQDMQDTIALVQTAEATANAVAALTKTSPADRARIVDAETGLNVALATYQQDVTAGQTGDAAALGAALAGLDAVLASIPTTD